MKHHRPSQIKILDKFILLGFSYQHVLLLLSPPCLCLFTALHSIWTVGRVSVGLFKHYSLGVNEELTSYQHHWETGGLKKYKKFIWFKAQLLTYI